MVRRKSENIIALVKGIIYKKTELSKTSTSILIFFIYALAVLGMCIILPREHIWTALFYSGVILGAVLFAALAENAKTSFSFNIFYSISFLILFFILGFRNFSGIDDASYTKIFNDVSQHGWIAEFKATTMESGYLLLNAIVSLFTKNYLYMQLLTSFIPLILFYHAFKKYRSMISLPMAVFLLCTMLYFQMLSVSLVRIFIAISIVVIAYYYIPKKNVKKYISLIVIASMFHYSALFMLVLLYFVIDKDNFSKKSKRFIVLAIIGIPVIFLAIVKLFVPFMGGRYTGYGIIGNLNFEISSFDTIPLIVLLIFYYKKIELKNTDYFKLFLSIFSLSCIIAFYSSMIPLGRLTFYANSAFFLAAPMVSKALNRDYRRIIFYGIIILYGLLYVYSTQFTLECDIPHLFPYKNIFFAI